ncbi:hypothetical protein CLF_110091 [Clonorchis sinensis]|uniref:Uncharacterized protein n=1 Tax=Clonorchis sinensis TaxID=79923 RepID=G7YK88_CLOSI|nr:hypothetical protein CLF_110091 [Clonorchis sinensis]
MKELNLGRSGTLSELISELTFACRSKAVLTLRHAALNLVNLTVFGDVGAQLDVIVIWLSTLALHLDVVVQYFALLSTAFLLTKPYQWLTSTKSIYKSTPIIRPFADLTMNSSVNGYRFIGIPPFAAPLKDSTQFYHTNMRVQLEQVQFSDE